MKRLAALLALVMLAACTKSAQPGEGGRANGWTVPHVLRFANAEDVNSLNPLLSQQLTVGYMSSMTAAWLIKWNAHNLPYPELATEVPTKANGGVSKDGLTITYHLRKGLRWSDGAPLTADDVVWTYHAIMNPANNVTSRSGWDRIVKIDEPDKYTVVFHLSKPYAPFIVTFFSSAGGNPSILPKHLLAQYPNVNNVPFNALPVGAGPFKYKEWDRGQKVVMVPNPYYFRGQPKLKEVDFAIIPNRDTVLTSLRSHAIDMWKDVPGSYYDQVSNLDGFVFMHQPGYAFGHLDFNLSHPAVADPAVRYAIELATDRATLNRKFQHGLEVVQESLAAPTAPYYDPNIPLVPFDVAKANAVLDAAGWKRGPDGIREKNGVKLNLLLVEQTGSPNVDHEIEFFRSTWKQIGVGIEVRQFPVQMLFAPYGDGGIVYGGKWDVVLFNWVDDPIGDLSELFACDQIPPQGQNDVRWCNPKADAAMRAVFSDYDQAGRNADDRILFEQLAKDRPEIVLWIVSDIYVYNKDLKNFHPNSVTPFDNMMDVDI
ncbi:MAG TPA: peptide ABC transporter substrate-binding protein [Candidatus Acidoferrales bacterium]|nr:peptide ABC transporter substrate-binding protein [Candidatus Acidoferrales bacterium]